MEVRRFLIAILILIIASPILVSPQDWPAYKAFVPRFLLPTWSISIWAAAWWFLLAWVIATGCECLLWRRVFGHGTGGIPRQRKLLTDIFSVLIYVATGAIVAVEVFDQPLSGVFLTSGAIAIVIGVAMQHTLADLFAGLALNIERPFKAGDWITLDESIQGLVLLTNWRATHIRTRSFDELIIPNAAIARARLTNHLLPDSTHLANVEVPLRYGFDLERIEALMRDWPAPNVDTNPRVRIRQ